MQNFGPDDAYRKRYNVAVSRARDQLWVVDSLDPAADLKPGDIRKTLIEYSLDPNTVERRNAEVEGKAESPFEAGVAKTLTDRGYHLVQQWKVGAYRLDMVAVYGKKTVAIECDGERWHSGETKIREDMERQAILERLGWRFIRIRGSEYYRDPEKAMERVIKELGAFGIEPEESSSITAESRETELLSRVKRCAELTLLKENEEVIEPVEETIGHALNPTELTRNLPKEPLSLPVVLEAKPTTPDKTEIAEKTDSPEKSPAHEKEQEVPKQPVKSAAVEPSHSKHKVDVSTAEPNRKSFKPKQATLTGQTVIPGMEELQPETTDVIALLKKKHVKYVDKRASNGALWIVGGQELSPIVRECKRLGIYFHYKQEGGKQTGYRPGWWAKNKLNLFTRVTGFESSSIANMNGGTVSVSSFFQSSLKQKMHRISS